MAKQGIRLYRAVPGPNSLVPLIKRFCRDGDGAISSLEDALLPAIMQIVGEEGDVEVLPFGMLVRRTLEAAGEHAGFLATRAHQVAAIGQASASLSDGSLLKASLRFPGNCEAVAETLNELQDWEIDLDEAANSGGISGGLRDKLLELSLVRRASAKLLSVLNRELSSDQLKNCFGSLLDPEVRLSRLLVFTGSEAPPAKVRFISWMAAQGCDVTVVAPRHASEDVMFDDARRLAEELDCEVESTGPGNRLSNNLFAVKSESRGVAPKASVVITANAMAECEWALQDIRDNGEEGTAIFVRDTESYAPLLEAASQTTGVKLRIHRRVDLLENAFARLALECIEACSRDDVRRLLPLLKRSYLALPKEARAFLQTEILHARKNPQTQWEEMASAATKAPEGIDWFVKLLDWRTEVLKQPRSLAAWIPKLRDLGDLLPWHDSLENANDYNAKRDERAFTVMQASLLTEAHLETSSAGLTYTLKGFATRCRQVWEAADVSVPSSADGVPVVNSAWGLPPAKRLLVLGMLEGVFPRRRRENPILNDRERREISSIYPDSRPLRTSLDSARMDRDEFYVLCSSAGDELYLSYPLAGENRDNIPTFYLQRVRDALDSVETIDRSMLDSFSPPDVPTLTTFNVELGGAPLAKSRHEPTSPRALRDALVCPFQYQMSHTLRLRSHARTTAWYNLRFLPDSAKLFTAPDAASAEEELQTALRREIDRLSPDIGEWELRLLKGGGERLIGDWIRREFCSRKIWPRTEMAYGDRAMGEVGLRELMPGEVRLAAKVSGISHLNSRSKVIHLFETTAPSEATLSDADQLYYGLYFLASHEAGFESALEIDGMDGSRSLLVFDREQLPPITNRQNENVRVIDMVGTKQVFAVKKEFALKTKESLRAAIKVIELGEYQAKPGEHCQFCDYGELCRQSLYFSDEVDEEGDGS